MVSIVSLLFIAQLSVLQFPNVKAFSHGFGVSVNLSKDYGYRGESVNVTVLSNSSTPHIVIIDPTNVTVYDRVWGVNETRTIPISNTATYGMYFVKAFAGESVATTWFTVLEVFPWDIISTPYTREWKGINYTFSRDAITAQLYGETMNIDLSTLKELVINFGLTVSASYDKNRFRVMLSKSAISVNLTFTFVDSGCKLTVDGQLDQPREFTFRFENIAKVKRVLNKIYAGHLFFDVSDIVKVGYAFTYNKTTKELSVSIPQTFSLDPLISFDATSSTQGEGTSLSWSHTTNSLSNRLLLVGVSLRNNGGQIVSSVIYEGNSLTFLRSDANGVDVRTEIWYLTNPDFGTKTINVTFSASVKAVCGAITLLGVNQIAPFSANNGATGSSTSPLASLTSEADDWLFGILGTKGVDNLQDFIDQISNVDSHADHGTHSDFTKEQTAPDTVYDTLTEADTDTNTSQLGKTSGSGTSYRTTAADEVRLGVFTAATTGEVASVVFYGRGVSATNAKAIITDSSGNLLTNGVGAATAVSATAGTKTLTYTAGSRPILISGTTYWIGMIWQAAGRVYYDSTTGATSKQDTTNSYTTPTSPTDAASTTETWRLMYANINNINYELDLEEQWIAAEYSLANEELCIKTGSLNAENLKVDVRTGSTWTTVINPLVANQWNNVSVSAYLTSSTFTMRFIGTTETGDTSPSTWQIDSVLLHTWSDSLTITEGYGQTNRWNMTTGIGTTNVCGVGSTKAVSAGSQSLSWTISPSAPWAVSVASVARIEGTTIFSDGFESGDFSAWTGTTVSAGCTLEVSSTYPHYGNYSAHSIVVPGQLYAFCYKDIAAQFTIYLRMYIKFVEGIASGEELMLIDTRDPRFIWKLSRSANTYYMGIYAVQGSYYSAAIPNITDGIWHCIEIGGYINDTTGWAKGYLDGTLYVDQTNLNTTTTGITNVRFGNCYSFGYANEFYFDCVVVADAYIGVEGYALNLRVMDWDLTDAISGAIVYKDSDTKVSNGGGWANWTGVSGTVAVQVKYYGFWVNGTSVTMDGDKTINVQCKLYDVTVTAKPNNEIGIISGANVTAYNNTGTSNGKIKSGITVDTTGQVTLTNVPNATLRFIIYAKSDYSIIIANTTQLISSDDYSFNIIANQNYVTATLSFGYEAIIWLSSLSVLHLLALISIIVHKKLKKRIGGEKACMQEKHV